MKLDGFVLVQNYIETMGIELREGRTFEDEVDQWNTKGIMVNEELVKDFGWGSDINGAVGKRLFLDSAYYTVIGVVNNFHEKIIMRGGEIRPAIITLTDPNNYRFLTARAMPEQLNEINDYIQEKWVKIFPLTPYKGYYQSRAIEVVTDTNEIINSVNLFVAIVSILLSSIGLYTLVSLTIIRRIKEIGIRKVLVLL